jgi:hypothetical protein
MPPLGRYLDAPLPRGRPDVVRRAVTSKDFSLEVELARNARARGASNYH